ncbi:MAG: hypothetical protein RR321_04485 [Acidaminococcaceae bacterium]
MVTNNNLEIAKEILIAAINQGQFNIFDKRNNSETIHEQRISAITKAFKEIHKAVYESSDEEAKFINS